MFGRSIPAEHRPVSSQRSIIHPTVSKHHNGSNIVFIRSTTTWPWWALAILTMISIKPTSVALAEKIDVWLGTSGNPASRGIYHCTLDTENGKLSPSRLVAEVRGPGFLAMHPERTHLYGVGTLNGEPSVIAYRIQGTGAAAKLELLNSQAIGDGGAAHVAVHPDGDVLLTAQYGGGSVASFAVRPDGSLGEQISLIKHQGGSGVVPKRQDAPHAHWVGFSPDHRFAFVPDLGLDQVVIYRLDAGKLIPHGHAEVPAGGGPRHMKFHPSGRWAYVLNELDLSVSVFDYDAQAGSMSIRQTIPTVAKAELAQELFKSCSEIRVHPSGKFAYAANRGHDTITAFNIADDGQLSVLQNIPVRGATPRNFNLDPSSQWLLAAGQDSHTLACFSVDADSGRLTYQRSVISTPAPICVLFQPED